MKKTTYIFILSIMLLLCGCVHGAYHNEKPDDEISRAIYDVIDDELYYLGKKEDTYSDLRYEYLIKAADKNNQEVFYELVEVANEILEKEEIKDKVCIVLRYELCAGVISNCVEITNYSNSKFEKPDCKGLQNLVIKGMEDVTSVYDQPSTYIQLPNIKYLSVTEEIQRKADEQGIDWYDYWPDLVNVEVRSSKRALDNREPDDSISGAIVEKVGDEVYYLGKKDSFYVDLNYEFLIPDSRTEKNEILRDVVIAVNETIEKENISEPVCISFYDQSTGKKEKSVFRLCNFSNEELAYPDYDGLYKLVITGSVSYTSIYNDPMLYSLLPDIKHLKVSQYVGENQNIDWYSYWPELEYVENFTIRETAPYYRVKVDDAISSAIFKVAAENADCKGRIESEDGGLHYGYAMKNYGEESSDFLYDIVDVVNKTIEEEGVTNKVSITFYHEYSEGNSQCIVLYNYSDDTVSSPDCEGMQRLEVIGFHIEEDECLYNNPAIYTAFPSIKYLKIREDIQKKADEQGIDWYSYWPDLESVEVF